MAPQSTTLAKQDKPSAIQTLRQMLEAKPMQAEIRKALPNGWTPEKFTRVAITAAQKNPRIADCTAYSVAGAIMECAQLGLEPDPTLGHAYLVPFKNNRAGTFECIMIPGYRGFISMAQRSGVVSSIFAEVVRTSEPFDVSYGTSRRIAHSPVFPQSQNPKDWEGVYAVVEYVNGSRDFEFLEPADVERSRARSRAKDDGPWVTDTEAMWKKTAIRKLAKRLDLSAEDKRLPKLAALDEYREAGVLRKTGLGVDDYETIAVDDNGALPGPVERTDAPEPVAAAQPPAEAITAPEGASDTPPGSAKPPRKPRSAKSEVKSVGKPIHESQRVQLFREAEKIMDSTSVTDFVLRIVAKHGFKKSSDVTSDKYDAIMAEVKAGGYPES